MSPAGRRRHAEVRFFTEAGQVDEPTFWAAVERRAREGARARLPVGRDGYLAQRARRWRLRGRGVARLERPHRPRRGAGR